MLVKRQRQLRDAALAFAVRQGSTAATRLNKYGTHPAHGAAHGSLLSSEKEKIANSLLA